MIKMKKQIIKLTILLISILLFVFMLPIAYAHPGNTDAAGGHTDHSTGEYHYHHGYPAHQHYDMDGDGDVDCPYSFVDKTNHNSNSSNYSSGSKPSTTYSNTSTTTKYQPTQKTEPSKNTSVATKTDTAANNSFEIPYLDWAIIIVLVIIIICLKCYGKRKEEEIVSLKKEHNSEIEFIKRACNNKIEAKNATDKELQSAIDSLECAKTEKKKLDTELLREKRELEQIRLLRCRTKKAPLDVSFTDDGMPVRWKQDTQTKPYGDYTVFVSRSLYHYNPNGVYHIDHYCCGYHARVEHIFNVIEYLRPCKKCASGFFDFDKVPDWYTVDPSKEDKE